jgi:RNA polymerase sigma-70 factor, ECF subfamily
MWSDGELEAQIPGLRRYARALCGDAAQADDLVQDCLERALSRWNALRSAQALRPWLFTVLRNLWIDETRRRAARGTSVGMDEVEAGLSSAAAQDHGLALRDLAGAMAALAPEQREIILLVGLEGLSYAQAAGITGVPMGTVMSRLKRGRERLAHLLQDGAQGLWRVK